MAFLNYSCIKVIVLLLCLQPQVNRNTKLTSLNLKEFIFCPANTKFLIDLSTQIDKQIHNKKKKS